ncbi:putative ribonuclease H-like domain-containing protein [Tanacetum coccineum]
MQAELEEEERLAREREEDANISEWDNVQAMIDADYELAARLQAQEQEELTIEERSKLFVELMDKRKKHFSRLRAEEQRRKPLTKAQKMNQMYSLRYNVVPPPYTGNFMPPKPDLVYPSLNDFVDVNESVSESVVEKPTVETNEPKTTRKENGAPIIKDWVSNSDKENVPKVKTVEMFNKSNYEEIDGGFIAFGGNSKGGKITGKEFKLTDKSYVLLKVPRKDNMYSADLKNVVPQKGLTCLFAKATLDESNLWHMRLGHVNFKTMNKLVNGNLVRRLPSKLFEINQTCVACQKGKQHRASYKTKIVSSISRPLQMLHMDLFGLSFVKSLMKKMYCLVVTDDFSRFSWVFFLATKDKTSEILKTFITCIENLIDLRVRVIRCDNETEFKNRVMNQFCEIKGIKREFSIARTPQQNGVAERKNRTLIEAARTMLADSKLPTTFWVEVVDTTCYVQNRVCPVTILNTIDHLGKFDRKAIEGFFVGYSTNSKAFRVFNSRTRIVEENLHVKFSEDTPNIARSGHNWIFDIDALTNSMNYKPVVVGNQSNGNACTKASDDAGKTRMETVPGKDYILLPLWTQDPSFSSSSKDSPDAGFKPSREEEKKDAEDPGNKSGNLTDGKDSKVPSIKEPRINQEKYANVNNTNNIKIASPTVNVAGIVDNAIAENIVYECADDPNMPKLEEIGRFSDAEDDISGADMNNLDTYFQVSPVPTTRIHKDHPIEQIIWRLELSTSNKKNDKEFRGT